MKDIKEYFKSLPIDQQTDEVFELLEKILYDAEIYADDQYEEGYIDGVDVERNK